MGDLSTNPSAIDKNTKGMSSLLPELIMDILSRLPVKLLFQFKCVSRQWLHLISDPHFRTQHRNRSKTKPLIVFSTITDGESDEGTPICLASADTQGRFRDQFTIFVPHFMLSSSCCDLLFFATISEGIYVCNPSTRELARLQRSSHRTACSFGLGILASRIEYKIVHLFTSDYDGSKIECEIFTLADGGVSSGSWRAIKDCPFAVWFDGLPKCVNGFIYWLVCEDPDSPGVKQIMFFDLEKEEFGMFGCPPYYRGLPATDPQVECCYLSELKGFLCFVDDSSFIMDIWMLKDQEKGIWVKEYSIDHNDVAACIRVLHIPSEDQDGEILFMSGEGNLYYYNAKTESFGMLEISNIKGRPSKLYYDSFFSLGGR